MIVDKKKYLRLFPEITQDAEFAEHTTNGLTGSLNDKMFKFLTDLGMSGSLSDMLSEYWDKYDNEFLFSNGEGGAIYDPSDMSTMYQDSAGTTPVTAAGDPVGRIEDKSGNGIHAVQDVDNSYRPTLEQDAGGKWYLSFNGTSSYLRADGMDLSASDEVTVCSGAHKNVDTGNPKFICELSESVGSNNGTFYVAYPRSGGGNDDLGCFVQGYGFNRSLTISGYASPLTSVVTMTSKISEPSVKLRLNGVEIGSRDETLGSGNFTNHSLYIGSRAGTSLFFNGRLYSLTIRGSLTSGSDLGMMEQFAASRSAVVL